MHSANDLRNGTIFTYQENPWKVLNYHQHFKGRGRGKVNLRARNLKDGSVRNLSFQSSETFPEADVASRKLVFGYRTRQELVFRNGGNELSIPLEQVEWEANFLTKGEEVMVMFYQDEPIGIRLPLTVKLIVKKTEPGVKGDSVSNTLKPARLNTGLTVKVPLFIDEGEAIMIDTQSGEYRKRAA